MLKCCWMELLCCEWAEHCKEELKCMIPKLLHRFPASYFAWLSEAFAPSESSLHLHQRTSSFTYICMIGFIFSKSKILKWTLYLCLLSSSLNCTQGFHPQPQNKLKGLAVHFSVICLNCFRECQMLLKK